jgi:hypothetical protein
LKTFNSLTLETKLAFSVLRLEIDSLEIFNSSILAFRLAFSFQFINLSQVFTFFYFLSISIFHFDMFFIFFNNKVFLAFQEIIPLINGLN